MEYLKHQKCAFESDKNMHLLGCQTPDLSCWGVGLLSRVTLKSSRGTCCLNSRSDSVTSRDAGVKQAECSPAPSGFLSKRPLLLDSKFFHETLWGR